MWFQLHILFSVFFVKVGAEAHKGNFKVTPGTKSNSIFNDEAAEMQALHPIGTTFSIFLFKISSICVIVECKHYER